MFFNVIQASTISINESYRFSSQENVDLYSNYNFILLSVFIFLLICGCTTVSICLFCKNKSQHKNKNQEIINENVEKKSIKIYENSVDSMKDDASSSFCDIVEYHSGEEECVSSIDYSAYERSKKNSTGSKSLDYFSHNQQQVFGKSKILTNSTDSPRRISSSYSDYSNEKIYKIDVNNITANMNITSPSAPSARNINSPTLKSPLSQHSFAN